MSKYKDREGKPIKIGDVVARAITINHDTFKGFNFSVNVCKRKGRELILDGVFGWCRLSDSDAKELHVITGETDLRKLYCDFSISFPKRS